MSTTDQKINLLAIEMDSFKKEFVNFKDVVSLAFTGLQKSTENLNKSVLKIESSVSGLEKDVSEMKRDMSKLKNHFGIK